MRAASLVLALVFLLPNGLLQSDRYDEVRTVAELDILAGPGAELTYTVVPKGSEVRIGVDRDGDSFFDRDEVDACADPADPASVPDAGEIAIIDLVEVIVSWGSCDPS